MLHSGVRNNSGVSEEGLRKYVPSIFAETPHESRSERYTYIPTWNILQKMMGEGFIITSAQQSRTRDPGKREFTKHVVRLRQPNQVKLTQVGDTMFELVFKNSFDGTSAFELMAGLFKLVCLNGMTIPDSTLPSIHVHHKGRIMDEVIDASYEIVEQSDTVIDTVQRWKAIELRQEEKQLFAVEAGKLRFDVESESELPISPVRLLQPRRTASVGNDLWNTFNNIQENVIKGGIQGKKRAIRGVKGIDQDLKLNKALWSLAEKMAELKSKG